MHKDIYKITNIRYSMSCMYCVPQRVFQGVAFFSIHISPLFVFYINM